MHIDGTEYICGVDWGWERTVVNSCPIAIYQQWVGGHGVETSIIKIWMISDHSISINNCLSDRCRWSSLFRQCRVEDSQLNMYRNFRSYEIQLLCSYFDLTNWSNKNKSSSAQQISSVLAMEQIPLLFNLQRVEYLFLIHIPQQIYV